MRNYDVAIIGAGILGLSTAFKLLEKDRFLKICIIEKENSIALHQTGHNSGVIHSGIYYKPGSLKALNCIRGYRMLLDFCHEHNIDHDICGKIIVATDEKEIEQLDILFERAMSNGLSGTSLISETEIKDIEPRASGIKGIFVPQTGIVNYKNVSSVLAQRIKEYGGEILLGEEFISIITSERSFDIKTKNNFLKAKTVVACAGLHSDTIAKSLGLKINFRIIPFRGEYYNLKKESRHLVKNLIYPVPDPEFPFLGVHFTRDMDSNVEAGPNAVLAFRKEGYSKKDFKLNEAMASLTYPGFHKIAAKYWKTGLYEIRRSFSKKEFVRSLQKLVPQISASDLTKGGSGVRAQACTIDGKLIDDFLFAENERAVCVCNAPSPAATSSLSIGETVSAMVLKKL